MPHLDRYEDDGLDAEPDDYDEEAELEARLRAEAALDDRDDEERGGRIDPATGRVRPRALEVDEEDDVWHRQQRRRRAADRDEDDEEEEEFEVDIENYDGPLREWINRDRTKLEIKRKFARFLRKYTAEDEPGNLVYRKRIRDMCVNNRQSLEVSYLHLSRLEPTLAIWVADAPAEMFEMFHEAAKTETLKLYPSYESIHKQVFVRLEDLPIKDQIRDIRQSHLEQLIKVEGVVTKRTGVFPQLQEAYYTCGRCGFLAGPILCKNGAEEQKPGSCVECQSKGPWAVSQEKTLYRNYQRITLQESPGNVPAGRLPRSKIVILLNDLIDQTRPGDEVEVTGVFTTNFESGLNIRTGFPVFNTHIVANHLLRKGDRYATQSLTDEDKEEIRRLSRDPRICQRIIKSIAPSIHGHDDIKAGISLALFSGQEKIVKGKTRLRGDINMLLLGDPGVAKSQFLKYVEKTANRAVYATGKGASAVGLTAAVQKDPVTREWVLQGGALVMADRGVCLIDEFDKMNDQDRVSIHEAMEQQSISISKAGIVTSLQARCSVIAAANPVGGRYDSSRTFSDNVELTDPILSRFDILCVVKDTIDSVLDERLARFVVGSHVRSHKDFEPEVDDPDGKLSIAMTDGSADNDIETHPPGYAQEVHLVQQAVHQAEAELGRLAEDFAGLRRAAKGERDPRGHAGGCPSRRVHHSHVRGEGVHAPQRARGQRGHRRRDRRHALVLHRHAEALGAKIAAEEVCAVHAFPPRLRPAPARDSARDRARDELLGERGRPERRRRRESERERAARADDGAVPDIGDEGDGVRSDQLGSVLFIPSLRVRPVHARRGAGFDLPRAVVRVFGVRGRVDEVRC